MGGRHAVAPLTQHNVDMRAVSPDVSDAPGPAWGQWRESVAVQPASGRMALPLLPCRCCNSARPTGNVCRQSSRWFPATTVSRGGRSLAFRNGDGLTVRRRLLARARAAVLGIGAPSTGPGSSAGCEHLRSRASGAGVERRGGPPRRRLARTGRAPSPVSRAACIRLGCGCVRTQARKRASARAGVRRTMAPAALRHERVPPSGSLRARPGAVGGLRGRFDGCPTFHVPRANSHHLRRPAVPVSQAALVARRMAGPARP